MTCFIQLKVQYPNNSIVNGTLDVHLGKYRLGAAGKLFSDADAHKICAKLAAAKVLNGAKIISIEVAH